MPDHPTDDELAALRRYDTPTICNALELVVPERRTIGFTAEPLVCADPALPPIVGFARTATIRAAEPSPLPAGEARARRMAYYEYLAAGPGPTITVIQDLDARRGFGAFWGEVNSTIHKALGCLGAVTNGSFRDLDELAPGFQILGGEVGPSHAHVHVVDFGGQVNVFGMTVRHGDVIHADRHGAVVVPAAAVQALPAAVELIQRREKVILDACKEPGFDIARLKEAMARSTEIH
ncbi:MAG: RraA family protein [Kiloniellales bacterium]|nr:RraA family protein [Kiloniellales bacterium]